MATHVKRWLVFDGIPKGAHTYFRTIRRGDAGGNIVDDVKHGDRHPIDGFRDGKFEKNCYIDPFHVDQHLNSKNAHIEEETVSDPTPPSPVRPAPPEIPRGHAPAEDEEK